MDKAQVVLAGDRLREEGLADARRPVQEDPVPLDPVALGLVRVLEEEADALVELNGGI